MKAFGKKSGPTPETSHANPPKSSALIVPDGSRASFRSSPAQAPTPTTIPDTKSTPDAIVLSTHSSVDHRSVLGIVTGLHGPNRSNDGKALESKGIRAWRRRRRGVSRPFGDRRSQNGGEGSHDLRAGQGLCGRVTEADSASSRKTRSAWARDGRAAKAGRISKPSHAGGRGAPR